MNLGQVYRAIAAIVVYGVIDAVWNVLPPVMGMYRSLHDANDSPYSDILRESIIPEIGLAVIVFFILIGFANAYLAIEPAMRENSLARAMKNSLALGLAAYATYIVPQYMLFHNWPGILIPIDIIIGGVLSLVTSTIVTAVALKLRNRG
jgi:uncharacterized membrane protein